jgi:hypothetical protein
VLLAVLGVAEVALRLFDPIGVGANAEREAQANRIIRQGPFGLESVPGGRACYLGHEIVIGSHGMRNRETPVAKPAGTFRILVLGDSVPFGFGVAEEDAFPRVVERMLDAKPPAGYQHVEVINAAVPGANLVDSYFFLDKRGLAYQPDLVILTLVRDDVPEVEKTAAAAARRIVVPSWLGALHLGRLVQHWLDRLSRGSPGPWRVEELSPTGVQHVAVMLAQFKKLCGSIPLVLMDTFGRKGDAPVPGIFAAARDLGIPRIEVFLDHSEYMQRYAASPRDPHLNAAGHLEFAKPVVAWCRANLWK